MSMNILEQRHQSSYWTDVKKVINSGLFFIFISGPVFRKSAVQNLGRRLNGFTMENLLFLGIKLSDFDQKTRFRNDFEFYSELRTHKPELGTVYWSKETQSRYFKTAVSWEDVFRFIQDQRLCKEIN